MFFDCVYHNGLAERSGDDALGANDATHITDVVATRAQMAAMYPQGGAHSSKQYDKLMRAALDSGRITDVRMASTLHGTFEDGRTWLPGFEPSAERAVAIEILGPVPELGANDRPRLRWFGPTFGSHAKDVGKTKNGHSVLLRLTIEKLQVMLGGDLNRAAEDYLLRHYGRIAANEHLSQAIEPPRTHLGADILKCCHHGAADVTDEFLKCVDAFAYIVSSGDEESHAHPRPDLLGRLGKLGRGDTPLILCTELLRSIREQGRAEDFKRLRELDAEIESGTASDDELDAARAQRRELQEQIRRRNVGVYGAISLRTDGNHIEITFLLERPRNKQRWQRWQRYRLHSDAAGTWIPESN